MLTRKKGLHFFFINYNFGQNKLTMKQLIIFSLLFFSSLAFAQTKKVYREDFNNNNRNWPIKTWKNQSTHVKDGFYQMKNIDKKSFNVAERELIVNPKYDFSIETKAMQVDGTFNNGFGIVWGYYRQEDYNQFLISGDGYIYISSRINDSITPIKKWTKLKDTTLIKPQKSWNTLKVEQKGSKTYFYVNGTNVFETNKIPCTGVDHGLIAKDIMNVNFDYIEIKYSEDKLNLISSKNEYKLENLGANVNSKNEDKDIIISADGKTIFFTSKGETNLYNQKTSEIYTSSLQDDGTWSKAKNLGSPINNNSHNFPISISTDQNELYVGNVFTPSGEYISSGISKSTLINGQWSAPKKVVVKDLVNDKNQTSYTLAPDGKHLLLAISNEESIGGHDLFVSFLLDDGTWSKPKNMGSVINTFAGDFTPFMTGDNKTLFFSSYGHRGYGSADIFMSKRLDDTWMKWSKPVNVGSNVNSAKWDAFYCTSAIGDYAYMTAYDKPGGFGSADLYRIKLPQALKPDPVSIISGFVLDAETQKPIDAEIIYENLATGEELGIAISTKEKGYQISLPSGKNYGFLAVARNYASESANINLSSLKSFQTKKVNLNVAPIKKGQVVRINNLFFDLGKYKLRQESRSELNRMVDMLKSNPSISIEVIGHTDNQGNDDTNKTLSKNRANSVVNFLVEKGISKTRISSVGMGETSPVASNDTDSGRQKNRRVEFKIK